MRDHTIFHMLACGLSFFSPLITTPNRPGLRRRTADEMTRLRPRLRPLRHQERGFLRSRRNHQRYRLSIGCSPLLRFRPLPLRTPTVTREGRLRQIVKLSSSFNQIPISSIVIVNCNGCSGYWLQHLVLLARLFQPRVPFAANITARLAPATLASTSTPIACLPSNATSPIRREGECRDTPYDTMSTNNGNVLPLEFRTNRWKSRGELAQYSSSRISLYNVLD